MTMMMTTTATTTASTKAGTSITVVATTTIGIMMASAFAPATTIRAAVTRTFGTSLSSAASIRARGTSFSTTNPIGSSRPTTFLAVATGNGIATASMSMMTTCILAGMCCSIRASAAQFTSSSSACADWLFDIGTSSLRCFDQILSVRHLVLVAYSGILETILHELRIVDILYITTSLQPISLTIQLLSIHTICHHQYRAILYTL